MTDPITSDADALRDACNAAFHALGLAWCWDASHPPACAGADAASVRACLRAYLEQHQRHMLAAYDADFLADAILAAMARCGTRDTGAVDWREVQQRQIGI